MKHLKKFESLNKYFTQEDLDDIKDVLRDIMDEHNLLLSTSENGKNYSNDISIEYIDLKFYNTNAKYTHKIETDIKIEECNCIRVIVITNIPVSSSLNNDILNFMERLRQMGYKVDRSDKPYYFHIEKKN